MTAFAAFLPAAALLAAATTGAPPALRPDAPHSDAAPYVVVLKDTASRAPARALAAEAVDAGDEVGAVYDAALNGFAVRTTAARAAALAADPRVASVEPDTEFHTTGTADTTDTPDAADTPGTPGARMQPQAPAPWSLDRIDQRELPLDGSYTYPTRAEGVTVYVVDTGINTGHREFGGRARNGYNAVFLGSSRDCSGHGTHVAATVGGETYGVAKGVSLVGVKVADCRGSASLSAILKGLDWVVKDATRARATPAVANMSIGGTPSYALDAAVVRAVASGITFTAASKRDGKDACSGPRPRPRGHHGRRDRRRGPARALLQPRPLRGHLGARRGHHLGLEGHRNRHGPRLRHLDGRPARGRGRRADPGARDRAHPGAGVRGTAAQRRARPDLRPPARHPEPAAPHPHRTLGPVHLLRSHPDQSVSDGPSDSP